MKNKSNNRAIIYIDGATMKLSNRRISIQEINEGEFILMFRSIDNDKRSATKHRAKHKIIKGKVVQTSVKLTVEAVESICYLYHNYIQNKKRVKANKEDDQESKLLKEQFNFKSVSPAAHDDHP